MRVWFVLLTFSVFSSLALGQAADTYTLCFDDGGKCHSIYNDRAEFSLKGNVMGTGPLAPKRAVELKQKLDGIFAKEKTGQACSNVELTKMSGTKQVGSQTYCYEQLSLSTKNALAQWIKSLPRVSADPSSSHKGTRLVSPFAMSHDKIN